MYTHKKDIKRKRHEEGMILVIGVIVMAFLLLLVLPFLYQLSAENRLTDKSFKSNRALSLAEAGIERAMWELNFGDILTWDGDSSLRTLTIQSFQASSGDVIGDIEIEVYNSESKKPLVKSRGKVDYSDSAFMAKGFST